MNADLNRRIENIVRFGTIAEVDHAKRRTKVLSGGIRTDWLPWLEWRAGTTRSWSPPTIGEQCVILAASGELTTAVVLFGLFTLDFNNPSQSPDEHVVEFADGARIAYNQKTHALKITNIATAHIQASTRVVLETPLVKCTQNLEVGGNVTVSGSIKSNGDQTAGGISQMNHVHGGSPKPS
ncbi:phage baseplate assembly protein V [Caviibacterium pharyngocola]|uniref:Phage baseplate assembly protein V n=1 Tax=Caviibacterium pharyngocola TaxID=28159 RepID=A0A2M8RTB2_9PAST|nr:phage baseplate assembly protein V [Caviibacterium pharyngocola]PJG82125.1 phage baseplate assembly protein V [Caviibacterium pharyngocola]